MEWLTLESRSSVCIPGMWSPANSFVKELGSDPEPEPDPRPWLLIPMGIHCMWVYGYECMGMGMSVLVWVCWCQCMGIGKGKGVGVLNIDDWKGCRKRRRNALIWRKECIENIFHSSPLLSSSFSPSAAPALLNPPRIPPPPPPPPLPCGPLEEEDDIPKKEESFEAAVGGGAGTELPLIVRTWVELLVLPFTLCGLYGGPGVPCWVRILVDESESENQRRRKLWSCTGRITRLSAGSTDTVQCQGAQMYDTTRHDTIRHDTTRHET